MLSSTLEFLGPGKWERVPKALRSWGLGQKGRRCRRKLHMKSEQDMTQGDWTGGCFPETHISTLIPMPSPVWWKAEATVTEEADCLPESMWRYVPHWLCDSPQKALAINYLGVENMETEAGESGMPCENTCATREISDRQCQEIDDAFESPTA